MNRQFDYAVIIGRFQPFHNGHAQVIDAALKVAAKVIVLVGSSNRPRSLRNPFTFEERATMIGDHLAADEIERVHIRPLPDAAYDDTEWVANVQAAIRDATATAVAPKIAIIGSDKDNTTYYLRLFPQWSFLPLPEHEQINATAVRNLYFDEGDYLKEAHRWLPESTASFLDAWKDSDAYFELKEERQFILDYQRQWGTGPFMTTDAVVIQSGHVLLIERGQPPGVGKLALPGGFLNADETLLQGCLRELYEETQLSIPVETAGLFLKAQHTFDDVHRSPRARIITTGFLFELPPGPLFPVKGSDDAASAQWVEISALRTDTMFSDHAFIIRKLLKMKG